MIFHSYVSLPEGTCQLDPPNTTPKMVKVCKSPEIMGKTISLGARNCYKILRGSVVPSLLFLYRPTLFTNSTTGHNSVRLGFLGVVWIPAFSSKCFPQKTGAADFQSSHSCLLLVGPSLNRSILASPASPKTWHFEGSILDRASFVSQT